VVIERREYAAPVLELIEREFAVDLDASISLEQAEDLNAGLRSGALDRVGYAFPVLIGQLSDGRAAQTEWKPYADLRVAFEVLTVGQRAWEWIDGDLPYNWDKSYPPAVRSRLARVAFLLHAADEELGHYLTDATQAQELYDARVLEGDLSLPLDAFALDAYLRESEIVGQLVRVAEAAGMRQADYDSSPWPLEQLLGWLCSQFGLVSLADLDETLRRAADRAEDLLGALTRLAAEHDFVPWALADSVVAWLLLVLHRADPEVVELTAFDPAIERALNVLIGNPAPVQADEV
jgi:hypothetical protein